MAYNYNKLRGRIVEKFKTQRAFANAMGWSERTLSLKMNGVRYWDQPDINKAMELLGISLDEIQVYFFDIIVQQF